MQKDDFFLLKKIFFLNKHMLTRKLLTVLQAGLITTPWEKQTEEL